MRASQVRLTTVWSLTLSLLNVCQLSPAENRHEDPEAGPDPDIRGVVPVVRDPADGGGGRHQDQSQLQPELQQH